MKIIRKSSEEEMIAFFLKTEIASARHNKKLSNILKSLNVDADILMNYNLNNTNENIIRKNVLAQYRGYGLNKEIFENFPEKIDWLWVELISDDIKKIKYIDYDYWVELSQGSRFASDALQNIKNNIKIFNVSNDNFIKAAKYFRNGGKFEPMILVAARNSENLIVLEGHLRLTVMNMEIDKISTIHAIIGYAKKQDLDKWYEY